MMRWDIINAFIEKYGYENYLEIGLERGLCRDKVVGTKRKTTVDPDEYSNNPTYLMTSDNFFKQNTETFDIIFIDGLHHAYQVYKDILESLDVLNQNGTILLHDMLPTSKKIQQIPRISSEWTGDCYKAFIKLRMERKDLEMFTVNTDWGIGIIRRGHQKKLNIDGSGVNYESFSKNKMEWMNIIDIEDFYVYISNW